MDIPKNMRKELDAARKAANMNGIPNSIIIDNQTESLIKDLSKSDFLKDLDLSDPNNADHFYKKLKIIIEDFENKLDKNHEVCIKLVKFDNGVQFRVRGIGYYNPSLILFNGETENGETIQLVQHVNQINLLLMKIERSDPKQPKQKIGFYMEAPESEVKQE